MIDVLKKVLIVDDDALISFHTKFILESSGFICETTSTVKDAIKILQTDTISLMLCDHDLADGTGREILNYLNSNKCLLPVVYLTAAPPSVTDSIKCFSSVKTIIEKPGSKLELLMAVKRYFPHDLSSIYPRLINAKERSMLLDSIL